MVPYGDSKARDRVFFPVVALAALGLLAGCSKTPSSSPAAPPRTTTADSRELSQHMTEGMKLLMDSVSKPTAAFHLSYRSQENLNPKFPMDASAKPDVGPVDVEADVSPDSLNVQTTRGKKTSAAKATRADQLAWPMAQLEVSGTLLGPSIAMAFGGVTARDSGADMVAGVAADKIDFDTTTATASQLAGLKMAQSMLGGRIKFESVKGTAWLEKSSGKLVKLNVETDLADQAGNSWKESYAVEVTAK